MFCLFHCLERPEHLSFLFLAAFFRKSNFESTRCSLFRHFGCLSACLIYSTLNLYYYISRCGQRHVFLIFSSKCSKFLFQNLYTCKNHINANLFVKPFDFLTLFRNVEIILLSLKFDPYSSCQESFPFLPVLLNQILGYPFTIIVFLMY